MGIHFTQVGTTCGVFVDGRLCLNRSDWARGLRSLEPAINNLCPEGALPSQPRASPWENGRHIARALKGRNQLVPPFQG
jgi:hypothetical protein